MAHRTSARKTAPGVKDGRVQKKNRTDRSEYLALVEGNAFTVLKHRANPGYRHVLQVPEVHRFVDLIPSWPEMSKGLSALAFDAYGSDAQTDTHYEPSYRAIWMRPFPESMHTFWPREFYARHQDFVSQLGVAIAHDDGGTVTIAWTIAQAKAWQLLHLFLYDLSVHDQFMRRGQKLRREHDDATAETYALATARRILPAYEKALGPIA